jgi:anaerobic selenocysteine-containing dehydrogenase
MRSLGGLLRGKPGSCLTRTDGLQFGAHVRSRCDDNGWVDIKNTDMILIMGGNPAENHPCGFKWAGKPSVSAMPR